MQEQLLASLCTTYFTTPIICSAVIMDIEKLHNNIHSSLPLNSISAAQLPSPCNHKWTLDKSGLLQLNDQIFILDIADLQLKVLQNKHNHILAGHVEQNKTLEAVCHDYVWPNLCYFCPGVLQLLHHLQKVQIPLS